MFPSALRASKQILAFTRNNGCTNLFTDGEVLFQKKLTLRGFSAWPPLLPNILWFLYFLSSLCRNHMMPFCGYLLRYVFPRTVNETRKDVILYIS